MTAGAWGYPLPDPQNLSGEGCVLDRRADLCRILILTGECGDGT